MSEPLRLLGAVLAGGRGARFGGPKADARLGGMSMVRRAVDALGPVVEHVVIVSSRRVSDAPVEVLPDATTGVGPLGGLQAALNRAAAMRMQGVFALACDLPLVEATVLRQVRDALGGRLAVAPRRSGGGVEPLCAVYRIEVSAAVARLLDSEDRSLHALFRHVGGVGLTLRDLGVEDPEVFLNVNTPAQHARAEAVLRSRQMRA